MLPEDRDTGYLWDMLDHARTAVEITQGITFQQYSRDRVKQLAIERLFAIIGEAARRVSVSFRDAHPEIPWREIIGQRNVLSHEYAEVLQETLWKTATEDVPALVAAIGPLLPPSLQDDQP